MDAVMPATMTAWRGTDYGPAHETMLSEVPMPTPGRGEVMVRVSAVSLSAGDVRLMLGDPLIVRPAFGLARPKQPIRGIDVAGTVVAVGEDVEADRVGEEVVVELAFGGGLAEFAIARADRLVGRPSELDPAIAATLLVSGGTAFQALELAGIGAGQRVLVLGGSGGVGTFTVQLAASRGAEVWATCGERNRALIESLGATRTFDYRTTDVAALPGRGSFDAIIDIAGDTPLRQLKQLVTPVGTIVLVTGDGGPVLGPLPRMLRAALLSIGSRRRIRPFAATPKRRVTGQLIALTLAGSIAPVIEREYPFDQADAALARVASGRVVGKVVVRVRE